MSGLSRDQLDRDLIAIIGYGSARQNRARYVWVTFLIVLLGGGMALYASTALTSYFAGQASPRNQAVQPVPQALNRTIRNVDVSQGRIPSAMVAVISPNTHTHLRSAEPPEEPRMIGAAERPLPKIGRSRKFVAFKALRSSAGRHSKKIWHRLASRESRRSAAFQANMQAASAKQQNMGKPVNVDQIARQRTSDRKEQLEASDAVRSLQLH